MVWKRTTQMDIMGPSQNASTEHKQLASSYQGLMCQRAWRRRFRSDIPEVRHSRGPLGLTLTLTLTLTPGMADLGMADPRNGGPVPKKKGEGVQMVRNM